MTISQIVRYSSWVNVDLYLVLSQDNNSHQKCSVKFILLRKISLHDLRYFFPSFLPGRLVLFIVSHVLWSKGTTSFRWPNLPTKLLCLSLSFSYILISINIQSDNLSHPSYYSFNAVRGSSLLLVFFPGFLIPPCAFLKYSPHILNIFENNKIQHAFSLIIET